MQITPSSGDLVLVRGQRWRVLDARVYERSQLVSVTGIGALNAGIERRFLLPFDTVERLGRPTSLRLVGPRRWRRACRALLADAAPPGGLRTAGQARIDLLPHQLEPALAMVRGHGTRALLADDVGLGKTIQAGLIVKELLGVGMAERVLILTPAGLREQWVGELSERFGIQAALVDFADVRRRVATLPVGLNPWATIPIAVTSIDFVKRPEVHNSVASCRWDVLIVDEAHGARPDSDRHAAVAALAARAAYVLLLTATPHNGDPHAFNALCRIGAHGDSLLVFRRTRAEVMIGPGRRVHRLHVRPSAEEARMHALLRKYSRIVEAEHQADVTLALSVLHKRALSSAQSLALSIERRLVALGSPGAPDAGAQLLLPLDPGGELDSADAPPPWAAGLGMSDRARERRLLEPLADAAWQAARHETKVAAIRRLLDRITEPVVVFTEYRDTLLHLRGALSRPSSVLHGGLARDERRSALRDFLSGRHRILLATDAAGEGLNLHETCRVVINLELPWNPMRLEQRIGRVDRIGQRRTIHVFHLVARASGEERILERLMWRIARAREEIDVANPIADERDAARLFMGDAVAGPAALVPTNKRSLDAADTDRLSIRIEDQAVAEVGRLACARRLWDEQDAAVRASLEGAGTWISRARLRHTRVNLGARALALLRVEHEDGHGRVRHSTLVPVAIPLAGWRADAGLHRTRQMVQETTIALRARAEETARGQRLEIDRFWGQLVETRWARERAITKVPDDGPAPFQAGLFDRRAEHQRLAERSAFEEAARDTAQWMEVLHRAGALNPRPARLLLVLTP